MIDTENVLTDSWVIDLNQRNNDPSESEVPIWVLYNGEYLHLRAGSRLVAFFDSPTLAEEYNRKLGNTEDNYKEVQMHLSQLQKLCQDNSLAGMCQLTFDQANGCWKETPV